ncbi:hypothetical protein HKX48_007975 [Thoreauomyces humboldtii]|nr:hypothetical protein HKX48_007975 [Thoreauomyces humboldtii]
MSIPPPPPPRSPGGPIGGDRASPSAGPTKLYVGQIAQNGSLRDLEDLFAKFGRISHVEIKPAGFGFVEFEDPRDAEDAVRALHDHPFEGKRLVVEFSKRASASNSTCFICNQVGHWVRECPENQGKGMDVRSGRCFKCDPTVAVLPVDTATALLLDTVEATAEAGAARVPAPQECVAVPHRLEIVTITTTAAPTNASPPLHRTAVVVVVTIVLDRLPVAMTKPLGGKCTAVMRILTVVPALLRLGRNADSGELGM